ncbi:MAG: cob(I)yrinic acid a,c-diamide adenosyltransferase [Desulfobacterales bacterium]|nr:cob(I)yrinic acid a,c-diamide adenosyltransferase [Desulfobacterales bacterium]
MTYGFVQVYTGNGKGKTTAAIGAVVRALGHGKKCYIGQFMKGIKYGEVDSLKRDNLVEIEQYGDIECITKDDVTEKHIDLAYKGLLKSKEKINSAKYDLIVLDEINVAIWFGLLKQEEVLSIINNKPKITEIIATGRYAPSELIEIADLVTEMKEIKHYYSKGVLARDGFER